ncbi:MAG: hypothetical protein N3B12_07030 [Armatimonadetes bacterium]|nr:hypothetical protein [Armatimonadota bacterium]
MAASDVFMVAAAILILLVSKPSREGVLIGLPFAVAGEGIRLWTARYLTKLSALFTSGPYALCRTRCMLGRP